jgi:malonyl CoA-acyl carrier protein transacylase
MSTTTIITYALVGHALGLLAALALRAAVRLAARAGRR